MSPTFRQSHIGSEHSAYDRYANISARGPCTIDFVFLFELNFSFSGNHTAVRLVGDDRVHDYINANQIPVSHQVFLLSILISLCFCSCRVMIIKKCISLVKVQ